MKDTIIELPDRFHTVQRISVGALSWRKCSDGLPPLHEDVLVAYKTEWQWEMRIARRMEGDWYDGYEFKISPGVVTHWARLQHPTE